MRREARSCAVAMHMSRSELVLESQARLHDGAAWPGRLCVIAIVWMMLASTGTAFAEEISLNGWTHQKFSLFGGNVWHQSTGRISVESDDSVSLLWRAVPDELRKASSASWSWSVEEGVHPTDLSQKGGDDRNQSLYFIFAPKEVAAKIEDIGIKGLLEHPDIRVLMYVWGGRHDRGDIVPSPYLGSRGMTIVLRGAGDGQYTEDVEIRSDLERIYGREDLSLIGLALSADSDDTNSRIRASIGSLRISGPP